MKARTPRVPVAALAAATLLAAHGAAAQTADPTFSADVTVTHRVIDRSGAPIRELPTSRYRLNLSQGGALRLTMLATRTSPASGPLADRYAGITVDTGDDGWPHMRDAAGRTLDTPRGQGPVTAGSAGDDGLVVRRRDRAGRLAALGRRFGRATGTVGRLSRYVLARDGVVEEALVAGDSALPVEVNRLEQGALVEHHRFDYTAVGEMLVRTRTHSESALRDGSGARLVSVTTLSAVRVDGGAR
ncbi:MAG: hypothetical protein AB7U83_14825 [Vicinamibacterales bacterium]